MKKLLGIGVGLAWCALAMAEDPRLARLSLDHPRWLEEEVSAGDGVFALDDSVHVYVQALNAGPDFELDVALLNDERSLRESSSRVGDHGTGLVKEPFPLKGMLGGNYAVRVLLRDPSGKVLSEKQTRLAVSPRSSVVRPWTYRRSFNTRAPGRIALALGEQLLALKRYPEARPQLEIAASSDDADLVSAKWRLAGLLIQNGETDRALELLRPLETGYPNQYEVRGWVDVRRTKRFSRASVSPCELRSSTRSSILSPTGSRRKRCRRTPSGCAPRKCAFTKGPSRSTGYATRKALSAARLVAHTAKAMYDSFFAFVWARSHPTERCR